jgi:hypothetical protein
MDFKQLKKQSSLGSLTDKLLKEAEKMGSGSYEKDARMFSIERDKSGVGFAIVRFLPAPAGEESPFVKLYNHGFQVNGKWLIENCPTSLGLQCAICSKNSELWNSGIDANKKIVSQRKRKLSFYSNVYILKNPSAPELEGTVKIFRYGQTIFDKIVNSLKPEFEGDDEIVDPFDMWKGANFRVKIKTTKSASNGQSYPSYDDSVFESPSPLSSDDEELERIWKQCHSLQEIISPDKFKSEKELQKRLDFVLGTSSPAVQRQEEEVEEQFSPSNINITKELETSYRSSKVADEDEMEEDDDDLSRFQELVG